MKRSRPEGEAVIIVDLNDFASNGESHKALVVCFDNTCHLNYTVTVMSRLCSCPSESAKTLFGQLIENALAFQEFEYSRIHVVRDSYIEDSTIPC